MKEITTKKKYIFLEHSIVIFFYSFVPFVQQSDGPSARQWNSAKFQQSYSMTVQQTVRESFGLLIDKLIMEPGTLLHGLLQKDFHLEEFHSLLHDQAPCHGRMMPGRSRRWLSWSFVFYIPLNVNKVQHLTTSQLDGCYRTDQLFSRIKVLAGTRWPSP